MNIKSLLLGSAAALVAVSGARAADAIVAVEPEPVDYVRVCDVYGKGFYYIPGTETCISIGGYVRAQIVAADNVLNAEGDDYQAGSNVRVRLNFDVREETELGTLRAFARLQAQNASGLGQDFDFGSNEAGFEMDQGYIQLGGFLVGYRDTLWSSGIGGIEDGLPTDNDLPIGDFNTNQLSYTFASGGFAATLGIEDDATGDWRPDVHAKLAYTGAWGGVFINAVYDETYNRDTITDFTIGNAFIENSFGIPSLLRDGDNDAFALKAGLSLENLLVQDSLLKVDGHYAFDPSNYSEITALNTVAFASDDEALSVVGVPVNLEWSIGAGYAQSFGKVGAALSGRYGQTFDTYINPAFFGRSNAYFTDGDYYAVVGNLGYQLTNNFAILGEVTYSNVDFDGVEELDQTRGFLRFQRDF